MNERTEELAKQAAEYAIEFATQDQEQYIPKLMEKFAGLIVAECMEVFSKDLPEPGDGKMLEVVNRVCAVAEHFGVEQ